MFDTLLAGLQQAQSIAESSSCIPYTPGGPSACPASAFHSVTAAFATQGYWIQADILYYLTNTGMGTWAILIYVIAAISGIISMAMGFPPKLYLWFFMGPGVYHWLVQDTIPVLGVRWNVGPQSGNDLGRQERAQREVFRLAETGLSNAGILRGGHGLVPGPIDDLGGFLNPNIGKVRVSNLFVWYDTLLSDLAEWFIEWTGVFRLGGSGNSILNEVASGLPSDVLRTASALGVLGEQDSDREDDQHWVISSMKWQYLQDITGAKVHSGDLRDSFTSFLSGECGDALKAGLDQSSFIAASTAKGTNIPASVFASPDGLISQTTGIAQEGLYVEATKQLASTVMPTPKSVRALLAEEGIGSFRTAFPYVDTDEFREQNMYETIRCDQFLYLLVQMFRWEAGHHFYQMISGLPAGVNPATLIYTLFYGWEFRNLDSDNFFNLDILQGVLSPSTFIGRYDLNQAAAFMTDLILIHLVKNELAIAPSPFTARKSSSEEAIEWSRINAATVGAKSKFGEIYTWATLLPYIQGVLQYLLAIAYPFVCLFVLLPGWHKILFTWMTFWAWVKLWDVGFAIVVVLERSVWSMVGSNSDAIRLFSRVWSMQEHGRVALQCPQSFGLGLNPPFAVCRPGIVPEVTVDAATSAGSLISWFDTMRIFDKALTIGPALDLDVTNGWYIYIMAALYFAVPAVTGQIVLGAKSGAASLATQALQGTAQEVGRAVGTAHTADIGNRALANNATLGQAAYAKAMRQDNEGLALGALQLGNSVLRGEGWKDATGVQSGSLGQMSRVAGLAKESRADALSAGMSALSGVATFGERGGDKIGNFAGGLFKAASGWSSAVGNAGASVANTVGGGGALAMTAFSQWSSIGQAVAGYGRNETNRLGQIQYDAQQAQAGVSGFFYGGEARGLRDAAGKYEKGAEQAAGDAVWAAKRDFSNQVTGYLGAQGISDPKFAPSSKPQDLTGMSFDGQMGQPFQEAARYTDPTSGEYSNWLYGMTSDLQARYGDEAVLDRYASAGIGDELKYAFDQSNAMWDSISSDSGGIGSALAALTGNADADKAGSFEIFKAFNAATPLYSQADVDRGIPSLAPPSQFTNPFTTPVSLEDPDLQNAA